MNFFSVNLSLRRPGPAAILLLWLTSQGGATATDYIFNPANGTSSWATSTIWTPNGTPGTGDNIDATNIDSSGATLTLGGTTRTINNLTKTVTNRWNISGQAATLSTLNLNNLTIGTSNMIFFDGTGGGGLVVNAANVTVTAGTLFFGSTSLSTQNLSRGLTVSGTTTVSGGAMQMNVANTSSNTYSLGLANVSGTGLISLNNAPAGKTAATANVTGLSGSGGFIQTSPAVGQNGNLATLAITNTNDYSSGTVLRDGLLTNYGVTLRLTKAGAGMQTLTGTNTFTGATTITNGTLRMGNVSALGARTGIVPSNTDNGTNVSATGTLDLGGQTGVTEVIRLNGTGVGGNGALVNSGTAASIGSGLASITQTTTGSTAPTITLTGGGGTGATATATMGVTATTFTINGGTTTYSTAPTVTITGGGAATQATATANLTGGVVTSITINTVGAGYTSAPNIAFSAGTVLVAGTNPTGTGNATNFTPVSYNITAAGSGYTSAPTVSFSSGTFAATVALSGIVLAGNSSIGGTGDITVNGVVSESGGSRVLTKVGTNTLTLANAGNSYSGATIIQGGAVAVTSDAGLGTAPVAATAGHLTLNNGALATSGTFALNANRGIALGASGGQIITTSGTLTYGGIMDGAGGFQKAGAGTLILSGINTYGGATLVSAGVLSIAADSGLGTAPGVATAAHLTLNGGTLATTADMALAASRGILLGASGGTVDVAAGTTLGYAGAMAGGGLTKSGTGTLSLTTANAHTGATAVNAGTLAIADASALGTTASGTTVANLGTLALSGGITVTGETLTLTGDGAVANLGALSNASGDNTWTGNLTVTAGATRIAANAGSLVISGGIATSGTGNFNVGGPGDLMLSGVVSGPLAMFKSAVGAGTLTLSNPGNTYTGITTVGGGTLKISSDGNLGAVPGTFSATNLRIRGGASTFQTTADVSLHANRGIQLGTGGGSIRTDAATTLTVNGVISGGAADALTKSGAGRLVLAANNTNAGPTDITAGSLQVGLGGSGKSGTGAVTVRSGATLLGTGVLQGSSFTAESGSIIHAGDGTGLANYGTLTFTPASGSGAFDFQSGSSAILGLNPGGVGDLLSFDGLSGGTLNFNGNLAVLATGYTPMSVETFQLLDWANLTTVNFNSRYSAGSYGGYLLGNGDDNLGFDLPDISGSGFGWDISSFTLNGTIATVTMVPEPARMLLLALGLFALMTRRQRATDPMQAI